MQELMTALPILATLGIGWGLWYKLGRLESAMNHHFTDHEHHRPPCKSLEDLKKEVQGFIKGGA